MYRLVFHSGVSRVLSQSIDPEISIDEKWPVRKLSPLYGLNFERVYFALINHEIIRYMRVFSRRPGHKSNMGFQVLIFS